MRIIFNILLIIFGLPIVGATFMLIAFLFPGMSQGSRLAEFLITFGFLTISVLVFSLVYYIRARWYKNIGIFKSWRTFQEYMIENHALPKVSEDEKRDFVTWANLSLKDLLKVPIKLSKEIYYRICNEFKDKKISEEDKKKYIKCLALYTKGLQPVFKTDKKIIDVLPKKEGIEYETTDNGIIIRKKDESGFDIEIFDEYYEFTVVLEHDHMHYDKEDFERMIIDIILYMTKNARIEVHKRGNFIGKTRIQILHDSNWRTYSTTQVLHFPTFKKRETVEYYQNDLLTTEEAREEIARIKGILNN